MTPLPAQVTLCSLAFRSCLELFVKLMAVGSEKLQDARGQQHVVTILEVVDESLSRGMHAG